MALQPRIERDKLQRVILLNDVCVWSNRSYGLGLKLVRVIGFNANSLKVRVLDTGNVTRVEDSTNLLVITQQINANIADNVGANIDLEQTR